MKNVDQKTKEGYRESAFVVSLLVSFLAMAHYSKLENHPDANQVWMFYLLAILPGMVFRSNIIHTNGWRSVVYMVAWTLPSTVFYIMAVIYKLPDIPVPVSVSWWLCIGSTVIVTVTGIGDIVRKRHVPCRFLERNTIDGRFG